MLVGNASKSTFRELVKHIALSLSLFLVVVLGRVFGSGNHTLAQITEGIVGEMKAE